MNYNNRFNNNNIFFFTNFKNPNMVNSQTEFYNSMTRNSIPYEEQSVKPFLNKYFMNLIKNGQPSINGGNYYARNGFNNILQDMEYPSRGLSENIKNKKKRKNPSNNEEETEETEDSNLKKKEERRQKAFFLLGQAQLKRFKNEMFAFELNKLHNDYESSLNKKRNKSLANFAQRNLNEINKNEEDEKYINPSIHKKNYRNHPRSKKNNRNFQEEEEDEGRKEFSKKNSASKKKTKSKQKKDLNSTRPITNSSEKKEKNSRQKKLEKSNKWKQDQLDLDNIAYLKKMLLPNNNKDIKTVVYDISKSKGNSLVASREKSFRNGNITSKIYPNPNNKKIESYIDKYKNEKKETDKFWVWMSERKSGKESKYTPNNINTIERGNKEYHNYVENAETMRVRPKIKLFSSLRTHPKGDRIKK